MLITAYAVLLVTLSIQTVSDLIKSRSALVSNLDVLSEVIGSNAEAALIFEDRESAAKLLRGFASAANIQSAFLLTPEGNVMATYNRHDGQPWSITFDDLERPLTVFSNTRLHLYRPIHLDGQLIGAIYIQSNLNLLYLQLTQNLLLALFCSTRVRHSCINARFKAAEIAWTPHYRTGRNYQLHDRKAAI